MKHVSRLRFDFTQTYKELWPQIYKFIYYKVQNKQEAEELTQDVFQKVYKQIEKNNISENKIKAYLYTSARNTVYDTWRKRKRQPNVIMLEELKENGLEPSAKKESIEDNILVEKALEQLSETERKILKLRIIEGYKIDEVADMLDKPIGTIKSMQYRALKKLKNRLVEGGYFNE
ncbi:RNA polymerase sigma factor [Caldisalinibacter kiritimatiensis]|uniref:Putative RNA polymerase sigma factor n=1 Tax=Caldisalinibacter kiritimatiensis TaxID=1304284 RepID=R1CS30_9FIRM|nr:RNA polymerase sigma factor [Caldisalinibacter kiritimatiensis]EOC99488.1 Putative RNA polymerase sigma factor [Caldisalinibacter kiritimatiensis]